MNYREQLLAYLHIPKIVFCGKTDGGGVRDIHFEHSRIYEENHIERLACLYVPVNLNVSDLDRPVGYFE